MGHNPYQILVVGLQDPDGRSRMTIFTHRNFISVLATGAANTAIWWPSSPRNNSKILLRE